MTNHGRSALRGSGPDRQRRRGARPVRTVAYSIEDSGKTVMLATTLLDPCAVPGDGVRIRGRTGTSPRTWGCLRRASWPDRSRGPAGLPDVCMGLANIAGLHGLQDPFGLPAQRRLQKLDQAAERFGPPVAEIVQPVRRLSRRGRIVERRHEARDDVVNEGEVPPHVAAVEDPDRPPAAIASVNL